MSTTVPALTTFFGTSAATPSAAGIATLVRSANPALTETQVATIMTDPGNAQACATATPGDRLRRPASSWPTVIVDDVARLTAPTVSGGAERRRTPERRQRLVHLAVSVTWTVTDPRRPVHADRLLRRAR